jgi:hypothetical protein
MKVRASFNKTNEEDKILNAQELTNLVEEKKKEKEPNSWGDLWNHPKIQGYLSFVESKIREMEEYAQITRNYDSLSFDDVNRSLSSFYTIYLSLLSLYHIATIELEKETLIYQQWFDELYIKIRGRENNPKLSAQKWLSQKEIEAMVKVEHKEEYFEHKSRLIAAERQAAFLRRLVDSWEGHKFTLQTLSKNLQKEYDNSNLADLDAG